MGRLPAWRAGAVHPDWQGQGIGVRQCRSALIRQAVERLLEDVEDIAVSEGRLQDADDKLIPWDQVKAEGEL